MRKKKPRKKKAKTVPVQQPPKRDLGEIEGLFLVTLSLMALFSLISFAFSAPSQNSIGVTGQNIGWFLHSIFGLSSYFFTLYAGWIGAKKLINNDKDGRLATNIAWFFLAMASLCLLLSLVEDRLPFTGEFLQRNLYPSMWQRHRHYHLGGAFFYYLYKDLPTFNLDRIFNTAGILIIFSSTLIAALLSILNLSFSEVWNKMTSQFSRRSADDGNNAIAHLATASAIDSKVSNPQNKSLFRYVRLRAPGLNNSSQEKELRASNAPFDDELLRIQPEVNLKARPSLSAKQATIEPATKANKNPLKMRAAIKGAAPQPAPMPAFPTVAQPSPANLPTPRQRAPIAREKLPVGDGTGNYRNYKLPPPEMLSSSKKMDQTALKSDLKKQAEVLEETLHSFGIDAKVGQINCGPTINSFEVHPSIGVKVQRIKTLEDDIALNMEAKSIRIIAPIPGKAAVGIEVPNPQPQEVSFKEMLQAYQQGIRKYHIPILLGKAVNGDYVMNDLTKMPHCIIAGATGSGKSVCINTIVMSILLTARPDQIKMIMIDPKKVELTPYTRLPHMLAPVITEPKGACAALQWLVKEMERRYEILKLVGNRNIESFNNRTVDRMSESKLQIEIPEKMYYIVCIVDELADLMMVSSNDIETPIARIAQMARAVGIHMILATQRPSREVITGIIKANFPTRIAFKVASRINSQIILDEVGAESLLGNGDLLFLPPGTSHLTRAQGAFIRDSDINNITRYLSEQAPPDYQIASFDTLGFEENAEQCNPSSIDSLYEQALAIVKGAKSASTTFLQRKLKIGYARAASLIDQLETNGIIGPADNGKARKLLIDCDADGIEGKSSSLDYIDSLNGNSATNSALGDDDCPPR